MIPQHIDLLTVVLIVAIGLFAAFFLYMSTRGWR